MCAVDKQGNAVDFLLTAKRDRRAARRSFTRALKNSRIPKVVSRQCKYLNNIVEQDQRATKRITRPIQGFKDFRCARII